MRMTQYAYKQRSRAQTKADEWQAAFPHLKVSLDYDSDTKRFRISTENPKTGKIGYLVTSGKI